jgi:large subunit ribosomal protein L4
MAKIELKNINGEKVKDITLSDSIFKIEVNDDALKKMIRLQLDSRRQGSVKTKSRAEVSGGGKKPWKQKGTGRARAGSNRSPLWRHGGHVFALTSRDYTFKINKKERVLALKSALTGKVLEKNLIVVDDLNLKTLKTKDLKNLLSSLKLDGKVLFVTKEDCENLYMASRNLGYTYAILAEEINCYDIVNADYVVCDEAAINYIEEVLK